MIIKCRFVLTKIQKPTAHMHAIWPPIFRKRQSCGTATAFSGIRDLVSFASREMLQLLLGLSENSLSLDLLFSPDDHTCICNRWSEEDIRPQTRHRRDLDTDGLAAVRRDKKCNSRNDKIHVS